MVSAGFTGNRDPGLSASLPSPNSDSQGFPKSQAYPAFGRVRCSPAKNAQSVAFAVAGNGDNVDNHGSCTAICRTKRRRPSISVNSGGFRGSSRQFDVNGLLFSGNLGFQYRQNQGIGDS
jgi:hypothetical protein